MNHFVKWSWTWALLLCSDATHKSRICVHSQLQQYWIYMVWKWSACTALHMFRVHTCTAGSETPASSEEDNWECLDRSCSEQRLQNLSATKPEKNLQLQAESWCKVCLSLQLHNLGAGTHCKFNPGRKVSCFNDINNFCWILSCSCPPLTPDTQQLEQQHFIWWICEATGRSHSCKDKFGFLGSLGWRGGKRTRELSSMPSPWRLEGFSRPPGQTGIWNYAGKPGRSAAGVAWLPRIVCGRSFSFWLGKGG